MQRAGWKITGQALTEVDDVFSALSIITSPVTKYVAIGMIVLLSLSWVRNQVEDLAIAERTLQEKEVAIATLTSKATAEDKANDQSTLVLQNGRDEIERYNRLFQESLTGGFDFGPGERPPVPSRLDTTSEPTDVEVPTAGDAPHKSRDTAGDAPHKSRDTAPGPKPKRANGPATLNFLERLRLEQQPES